MLINDRGEISFCNPASERIFGYNSSEVIGKNVHELLAPPEYHAAYRSGFKEFAVSGRGNAVGRITQLVARRKNGEEFPIELSLSGFKIDGRWHAAGIVRDTTNRKRAEMALKEIEERFGNFLNSSKDLVFIKDQHYRYLFVNKANQDFFGLSEQEIIGKTDFELMPEETCGKMSKVRPTCNCRKRYSNRRREIHGQDLRNSEISSKTCVPKGRRWGIYKGYYHSQASRGGAGE